MTGTSRTDAGVREIEAGGWGGLRFDDCHPLPAAAMDGMTHLLVSIPPGEQGEPALRLQGAEIAARAAQFRWVGYLSTTGVYGDKGGDWVDESTPLEPTTERGRRRVAAEAGWAGLGLPLHIFRLAGIYGPGRNQLVSVLDGTARRVVKPGQVFSRIHVEDIAGALAASIARPQPGAVYNLCDDLPCPPQEVVAFAAELLGKPVPREIAFDDAALSPMARGFYAESKRVSNARMKQALGYRLLYPTYREGVRALLSVPGVSRMSDT